MGIFSKRCLGIDIGAASVKVVECSQFGRKKKLENYAEFTLAFDSQSLKIFKREGSVLLCDKVSEVLEALLTKAEIKERNVAFSIPDFFTFFTSFSLPPMSKKEIPQAVEFEARHHIPLPLSDVVFDWRIIEKKEVLPGLKLKILLVAVPNQVLENYQKIAALGGFKLKGMEAEVFALIHSSVPPELKHEPVCLVDIGWQSTTVSIVEQNNLKISHSFDISGKLLTEGLSLGLKIAPDEAEKVKKEWGLASDKREILELLLPVINSLSLEIEKVCQSFRQSEGKKIENLVLAGGSSRLFGLKEYLETRIEKKVQLAEPFRNVSFPPMLGERLKTLGPSFAVAAGAALMGLER